MARKKSTELTFQQHIADFLVRVHGYTVLEQAEITDSESLRQSVKRVAQGV